MPDAHPEESMPDLGPVPPRVTRRSVLRGVGVAGAGVPLLAACGGSGGNGQGGDGGSGTGSSEVTLDAGDVPVGGGTILEDQLVVVTQPTEGEFQAFSAVCTHQGCPVQTITDGEIVCNCHGSRFSIEDGSVLAGPANAPLESKQVSVDGDTVTVS